MNVYPCALSGSPSAMKVKPVPLRARAHSFGAISRHPYLAGVRVRCLTVLCAVFTSQNPTGSGDKNADRAAFRKFLAGVRLQP